MSIPQKHHQMLVFADQELIYCRFEQLFGQPPRPSFHFQKPLEENIELYLDVFGMLSDLIRFDLQHNVEAAHNVKIIFDNDILRNEFIAIKDIRRPSINHNTLDIGKQTHEVKPLTLEQIRNGLGD